MEEDEMAAGGRLYIQISPCGKSETAGTPQSVATALLTGTECQRFAVLILLLPAIPEDSCLTLIRSKFLQARTERREKLDDADTISFEIIRILDLESAGISRVHCSFIAFSQRN